MVRVRVAASTSNLGSGFDCFGLALQLYLTVEMDVIASGLEISVSGEGKADIPSNATNLIFKSLANIFERVKQSLPGLEIRIINEIPLFRGLGSSGAATIAGLICGAQIAHVELREEEMLELANKIEGHPENAASSLLGGLTINCLEEKHVISKKIEIDPDLRAVLLIPEIIIPTKEARQVLPQTVPHKDAVYNLQRSALLAYAFQNRDYGALKIAMRDKMHQPFRKNLIPHYDDLENVAYENGALGVCISGSGSAILALVEKDNKEIIDNWQSQARQLKVRAKMMTLEFDHVGAQLI